MAVSTQLIERPGELFRVGLERPGLPGFFCLFVAVLTLLTGPGVLAAEQVGTGQVSSAEVLRRLQESGLTREQVRIQLMQSGQDPSLADSYFDVLEGRGGRVSGAPSPEFLQGLRAAGLLDESGDTIPQARRSDSDTTAAVSRVVSGRDTASADSLPVFGRDVFDRPTTQFDPVRTGPVPPDYRLGPGDELVLVLTGDVELAYTLRVSREGTVVIPDVGQVVVNGLTLSELEERLYDRLGEVYSGVRRGPDASTRFQLSLGRLRVNQVFVIGEVERPGAHEISSVGTVLSALYQAGGPNMNGSFRTVEVRRGGQVVGRVDIYDYLLRGDTGGDVRLQQGDIVFVPLAGSRVRVHGAVRREAIFEVRPEEGLEDVVAFAGGGAAQADLRRVRVDQILPPERRTASRERVLEVVDLLAARADGEPVPVSDGDVVRVPTIGEEQRDRVSLEGFVYREGDFELLPDMTLWDLIERAGGLRPEAYQPVAHIRRLNPADSTRLLHRVSLMTTPEGDPVEDMALADQDRIRVFGTPTLRTADSVAVVGEVKEPGRYEFNLGMTAEDLILAAGGFTERAHGMEVEVARLKPGATRNDTITERHRIRVSEEIPWQLGERIGLVRSAAGPGPGPTAAGAAPATAGGELPDAGDFGLLPGDQLFVRELPGYVEPAFVRVEGEVESPGSYAFNLREERLTSFVRRAGGVTSDAFVRGARLVRDSIPVGINLEEALQDPGGENDVQLRAGDRIIVPRYDPIVTVRGAVVFDSRVRYVEGRNLDYYLEQAGGALEEADRDRVSVEYLSGERAVTDETLWVFRRDPEVRPGSVIVVPRSAPGSDTDWDQVLTRTLSITSTIVTILLAANQL